MVSVAGQQGRAAAKSFVVIQANVTFPGIGEVADPSKCADVHRGIRCDVRTWPRKFRRRVLGVTSRRLPRRYPAWAIEGKLGRRFTLLWTSAPTLPNVIDRAADTQMSQKRPGGLIANMIRRSTAKCGSLGSRGHEADDRGGRSFVNVGRPTWKARLQL